jgi:DNA-binding transcriptional LysR family regulator
MELRHLRYFVAVAEEMHFGRAAQRLHIVQPALSKQIIALERELDVRLFTRTKRRVAFTAAGAAFYQDARDVLARVDRATELTKRTAAGALGTLDIGFVSPVIWSVLQPILRRQRESFPGVHLHLHELHSSPQMRMLREGKLDAGFLTTTGPDELLDFKPVCHEAIVVAIPEQHRLAGEERIDLAELANERFVLVSRSTAPGFFAHCVELCQRYGFSPAVVEEGNTPAALYGMVAAGLGVSLGPESASIVPWQGVTFKHVTKESSVEFAVAHRRGDTSQALASFLGTVDEVVAELEPGLLATAE